MNKRYSGKQIEWLKYNATAKVWVNRKEFLDTFNHTFNLNVSKSQFNNLLLYYGIKPSTKQTESLFTDEQKIWLIQNARQGNFENCKQLTAAFNSTFNQSRDYNNMYSYLSHWGVNLNTAFNKEKYTHEMDKWLVRNFDGFDYGELAEMFNQTFGTEKTAIGIAHRCTRTLGLKKPSKRFKKGEPVNAVPLGTISYRKREPYIKVNNDNDRSAWQPLRKAIYENHNGKIPKG